MITTNNYSVQFCIVFCHTVVSKKIVHCFIRNADPHCWSKPIKHWLHDVQPLRFTALGELQWTNLYTRDAIIPAPVQDRRRSGPFRPYKASLQPTTTSRVIMAYDKSVGDGCVSHFCVRGFDMRLVMHGRIQIAVGRFGVRSELDAPIMLKSFDKQKVQKTPHTLPRGSHVRHGSTERHFLNYGRYFCFFSWWCAFSQSIVLFKVNNKRMLFVQISVSGLFYCVWVFWLAESPSETRFCVDSNQVSETWYLFGILRQSWKACVFSSCL